VVVTEDAESRRIEHEMRSGLGRESKPSCCEYSKNVTVRKERHGVDRADPGDDAIDARANLLGAFAAGTAVREDHPVGILCTNLAWRKAFILAVIPLHEVAVDLGALGEAGELTRLAGATERARQNQVEGDV